MIIIREFKVSNSLCDYWNFSSLRSQCKHLTKVDYRTYVTRVENSVQSNVRSFWNFVNSKRGSQGLPSNMHLDASSASSHPAVANLFASYFGSVYTTPTRPASALNILNGSPNDLILNSFTISIRNIFDKLNTLDTCKGPGYDGIPPLLLKQCNFILSRPLWNIFNASLVGGTFPRAWKNSLVTPIFKAGDRSDVRNYRPISKLSVMPKLFEEIVTEFLSPLIANSLCVEQHGFVPRRSTATNLAVYHSFVSHALDDGLQVDTVYTDFQKAFDTVDHSILLSKLSSWGFCGPLLSWINSYLSGREQIVRVSNSLSSPINVTSGVPQVSHLGPLLFNVFINDLVDVFVGTNFLLYADDLKVFRRIHSQSDAIIMQDDLDRFALWCSMNNLRLHTSKCVVLRAARGVCNVVFPYKIGDDTLNEVSEVVDLGISITSCFDFRNQYMRCTCKALRTLGFISRFARHFRNIDAIKLLYFALVRPHVEYASVIWNPRHGKYISLIERVVLTITMAH